MKRARYAVPDWQSRTDRQTYDVVCKMSQADLMRVQVEERAQQNGQSVMKASILVASRVSECSSSAVAVASRRRRQGRVGIPIRVVGPVIVPAADPRRN